MGKKFGLIQVFRGFAAMLVVLCHMSGSTLTYFGTSFLSDIFFEGYIGVDFFFVLSGFVITYVHFKDIEGGSNRIIFLKKRFIRIYPIYWIIASAYLFLLILSRGKTNHLSHVMNFHSMDEWIFIISSFFLIPAKYEFFLPVAWSLSYELIFYIVFFVFILLGLKKAKYIFIMWCFLILAKICLSYWYTFPDIMILNERIIEFLSGCFVAYLILKTFYLNNKVWLLLFCLGIYFLFLIYPTMLKTSLGILILSFLMGLIVYKIVYIDIVQEFRYSKLFLLLGEASYSIYLSHLIFLSALFRAFQLLITVFNVHNIYLLHVLIIILFLFTILGGVLVFRFVETPVLRFFNKNLL